MGKLSALVGTAALLIATRAAAVKPWKPHPIHVIPGVPLKPQDIKPYTPPRLAPEPPIEPSEVPVVEVTSTEAIIEMRPWSSPMLGNALAGARLPVRGVVNGYGRGCRAGRWYALEPFGYVCGSEVRPSTEPPTTEPVLQVKAGERLPFRYVMVLIKDTEKLPLWASLDDLKNGAEPERQLKKGDTVAVEKLFRWDGASYWVSVDGRVLPQKGAADMGGGSSWHGLGLDDSTPLPFGWVTPEKLKAYGAPPESGAKPPVAAQLERRTRLTIREERTIGRKRWLRVEVAAAPPAPTFGEILAEAARKRPTPSTLPPPPPSAPSPASEAPPAAATQPAGVSPDSPVSPPPELWVSAEAVNEVRLLAVPDTIPPGVNRWIDIDLGEQVLVAYEGAKPLFATLISSGRAIATPMGTYPVWAKVSAITMKNQPYEEKEYFVHKVPWSTFFQWHNAIHGAYWHDRFGVTKSHGCVNVAPLDARRIFEWVTPPLPPGWTGLRPLNLLESPTVVVRNSHLKKQFRQDRPIGPPDRELEGQQLEEAEARRALEPPPGTQATAPGAPATPPAVQATAPIPASANSLPPPAAPPPSPPPPPSP